MVKGFDVLVVGAGPAGSAAAAVLAGTGLSVAVLDRAHPPRPKLCGGLLPWKSLAALERIFGLTEGDLAARGGLFHASPDYAILHREGAHPARELLRGTAAEAFRFVDRPAFDALLLATAQARGAEFFPGRSVTSCDPRTGLLRTVVSQQDGLTQSEAFQGRYVVGADGANSVTRRCLYATGVADREAWGRGLAAAIEVELGVGSGPGELPRPARLPELYVGTPSAGYGWVFPGPRGPKVGICGLRRAGSGERDFGALFVEFLRSLGVAQPESVPLRGHPLPYGNALTRPCLERLLLAGDAAGLVEPLFGEGIFYALATGAHAASAIVTVCRQGRQSLPDASFADPAPEYLRLLTRTVLPELRWSNRLRWTLFWAMRRFGATPIRGFVGCAPRALAAMVHGRRSFALLRPKRWEWGAGVGTPD